MAKIKDFPDSMKDIKKLVSDIPEDRRPLADSLHDEMVFMRDTMVGLKAQVQEEGATAYFKQGQQEFLREHPALTAYNKTLGRYNQTFKQLVDLLPESDEKGESDELMDFIQG